MTYQALYSVKLSEREKDKGREGRVEKGEISTTADLEKQFPLHQPPTPTHPPVELTASVKMAADKPAPVEMFPFSAVISLQIMMRAQRFAGDATDWAGVRYSAIFLTRHIRDSVITARDWTLV